MEKFLSELGVTYKGQFASDGDLVVDLPDSDAYNKVFAKFDKSDLLDEDAEMSLANEDISNIMYESENYFINLIADFNSDIYKIVVSDKTMEDETEE